MPAEAEILPLRPVALDAVGDEGLPTWLAELPPRPNVYLTLGTVTNSDRRVFSAVFEGLKDEPLNLIITVGENNDPTGLGPLPLNARNSARYIPQPLLLPRCQAVMSHGGSGTLLATLSHGLPHLMIPQGADQYVNAALCLDRPGRPPAARPDQLHGRP